MLKFESYIAIIAIILVSCQQVSTPNPTSSPNIISAGQKASDYLRSQIKLPSDVMIVWESQRLQTTNINDLCQIAAPTQTGFEITLVAGDTRYILQTNQDASKVEICRSEDAKPELTSKYIGAGYILRYPAVWKVIDLGLESSGTSVVVFTPNSEVLKGEDNLDLAKLQQKLQQNQQVYTIVARQPLDDRAIASDKSKFFTKLFNDGSETAKDLEIVAFDPKIKGAKSGSKQEFTKSFSSANNAQGLSSNSPIWKVRVLTIETDKFIYRINYYQPRLKNDFGNDSDMEQAKIFEQFANSFALVESN